MRIKELDLLRAVAVISVMGHHFWKVPDGLPGGLSAMLRAWARCGWSGVDLFFVLSGFLVSGLLFREYKARGTLQISRFLIRRGFKIYPTYYLLMFVTFIGMFLKGHPASAKMFFCNVLFIQNYMTLPLPWVHTWSLAVEEHFYLILGFLLAFLAARRGKNPFASIPIIFVSVACFTFLARGQAFGEDPGRAGGWTHLRIDGLFFGVLLSYLRHFRPEALRRLRLSRPGFVAIAVLLLSPLLFWQVKGAWLFSFVMITNYVGCGALLLACLPEEGSPEAAAGPIVAAVAFVGANSYSIYLCHLPIKDLLTRISGAEPTNYLATTGLYLAGSVGVGIVMAKLIEFPALRFRDRVFPSLTRHEAA